MPFFHHRIDFLAVADTEDEDFLSVNPENNPVIADPHFPVSPEGFPQGLAILMGGDHEAGLDRLPDPVPDIGIELRNIVLFHIWMIDDRKRHAIPRRLCG